MARTKSVPTRKRATAEKMSSKPGGEGNPAVPKPERKKYRFKNGTQALREIKRFQKNVDTLVPKSPFRRLTRELAQDYKEDLRFSRSAFDALQEASEAYLVELFGDATNVMLQAGKLELTPVHMRVALNMRHNHNLPPVELPDPPVKHHHAKNGRAGAGAVVKRKRAPRKDKSSAASAAPEAEASNVAAPPM